MRKARLPPKIPTQRSQTSMPVETEEVFEEAATEDYSDMAMISQVNAHVATHCTGMSYLSCQLYVTCFHV